MRTRWLILGVILAAAALLRLGWPDRSPPGIQVDEAANAWNARCLLDRGTDQFGQRWPVFYTPAFGDNRSPLYLYLLAPVQAVWGMSPATTRIPAALGGVLAVALIAYVGRRMCDDAVGLAAAALLAIDPWHLQFTRIGHEGSVGPTLVLAAIAALLWAGVPWRAGDGVDGKQPPPPPRLGRALLAGAVAGLACYGYAAIRLYLPIFLIAACALTARTWIRWARDERARPAVVCMVGGFLLAVGPLAIKHLTDPQINKRATTTWVWRPGDRLETRVVKVAARYPAHFGPEYLLLRGSRDPSQAPPRGFGAMHWYALPPMLVGLGVLVTRWRTAAAARVLLAGVALYPAADLLNVHDGANALRSFPGIWALVVLAAVGAVSAVRWLRARRPPFAYAAVAAFVAAVVVTQAVFLTRLFGEFNRSVATYRVRGLDVREACEWLRPRIDDYDVVFWTQRDMSFIYAQTLVYLDWSPQRWFTEPLLFTINDRQADAKWWGATLVIGYGKQWFTHGPTVYDEAIRAMNLGGRPHRAALILRPGESPPWPGRLIKTIRDPDGNTSLEIYECPA